ncbi:unnamed protein product [Ectocarpus sp. CCAP 1310/34]|nr:unnamed protein product [Ectocarpus sp. CCAP 1310/34]
MLYVCPWFTFPHMKLPNKHVKLLLPSLLSDRVMSEECCSACRQPTARVDVRCTRERTGGNVRAFVEAAGVADKFPALKCGDPDIDKLVRCKHGGCLLELFVLNQQKESRAPNKHRAMRGPKWTCAPEAV